MKQFGQFFLRMALLLLAAASNFSAQAQCNNPVAAGSASLPAAILGTASISCNIAQSYGTWLNAVNGSTYVFTSTIATDYLTIRTGTPNGPVVAAGPIPLAYTPAANGALYVHVNTNAACGTNAACRDITATRHNPCLGNFSNGTVTLPAIDGSTTFATSQQEGLYSTWNSAVAGSTYVFAATLNTSYLTIRSGTPNGPVVAVGTQPLTYTPPAVGTLYVNLNLNSGCGAQNSNIAVSATKQMPACLNTTASGSAALPAVNDGTATISGQQAGEYGTWSSAVVGSTYTFSSSRPTDYLTIRSGSPTGPAVAVGMQPIPYTTITAGSLYVHVNADASCGGTDFYSRNITATKQAPGCGNVFGYGSVTLPKVTGTTTSLYHSAAGEYGTWDSAAAGKYYVFSSSVLTDYLTVRRGSPDGQLVAAGTQPVACMIGTAGPLFVYVNSNSSCGSENRSRTITATSQSPGCINSTAFGTAALPPNVNTSAAISNQQATQYGTWTGAVAGRRYSFSSSVATDYLTVRHGAPTGPVVAYGLQPVVYKAIADGTLYVHVNTNSSCGTHASNRTITATNQSTACTNPTALASGSLPAANGGTASVAGVQAGSHYVTWNGAVVNGVYVFTSSRANDYLTIRTGSPTGPAVAVGTQPLQYTATAAGALYVHLSASADCLSSSDTSTIRVSNQSQACSSATAFGTAALPAAYAGTASIANQQAGQYGTWSNAAAGNYYVFTSTVATDYLTVRSGSPNGPVVTAGTQPVTYRSTVTGTLYVQVNTNTACGTQATNRTITATNQPPVCTNTTYSGDRTLSPATGGTVSGYLDQVGKNYAWLGAVVGNTYTFTSSTSTDYLTVCRGYANGPVVAAGTQPVSYTATTNETIYVHLNTDPYCGNTSYVSRSHGAITQIPECTNTTAFGTAALPVNGGGTATIANQQAGQYGTWNNAIPGHVYKFASSVATDYMTVRSGSPTGPVLISGLQPLTATATAAGPLYVHVNSNYSCGAQAVNRTITATRIINYCIPSATSVNDNGIVNVSFGMAPNVVNNTTSNEYITGYYGNYSNLIGDMPIGIPATVFITFQTIPFPYNFAIYVDLNDDGDFFDAGETVATAGSSASVFPYTQATDITIPAGTSTGQRRMRITAGASNAPAPCLTGSAYKCFEDYTVNIVSDGACTGMPVVGTASTPSPSAYCGSAPAKAISLNGFTTGLADISIQWQSSTDSIIFTNIANATATTCMTPAVTGTRYYRAVVTCNTSSQSASSNVVTITVNPTPTVTASTATPLSCGGASATLTASGADTYSWSPGLLTGSSITVTPMFTTTYTVTGTTSAGCPGTGTVTVTAGPNITLVPAATPNLICAGGSTLLNAGLRVGSNNGSFTIGAYQQSGISGGPFYKSSCANYKTQHIYTAAELTAAGLVAGSVNSITWYVANTPWGNPIQNFTISMGNTTVSDFAANTSPFVTGATQVYSTSSYQPVSGANTFTFSTPFVWDGTSNVLVQVCHDYACSGAASVQMSSTATARVLATENNTAGCTAINGNYKFNTRPLVTFGATTPAPSLTYSWTPAATLSNSSVANSVAAPAGTTTYTVQATSVEGCQVSGTVSVTVRGMGQWLGTASTDWNNAANWCGGVPTATTNILVPDAATVPYTPAVSSTGSANNITLQSGALLTVPAGGVLNLYGNITGPGLLDASAGTMNLAGSTGQTIMPGLTLNTLSVTGGSTKWLAGNTQVSNALNMTNGMIDVGSYTLSLGAGAMINGASSSGYVRTSGVGGRLRQQVGNTPVAFPVGNSTYNPVILTNTGAVDLFSAGVRDEVLGSGAAGNPINPIATYAVNRTWDIEEATSGGSNVIMRLQWDASNTNGPGFDYNHVYVSHYSTVGGWDLDPAYQGISNTPPATGYPGTGPYSALRNGITSFSPFTVGSAGGSVPLPLKLVRLSASNVGTRNKVEWESAAEQELDAYLVERSADGKIFTGMAKVAALGKAGSYSSYDDAPAHGLTYYRLKIVAADGSFAYSQTVKALRTADGETVVQIAPNPVQDVLTVSVAGGANGDVQLTDVAGRVVATAKVDHGQALVNTGALPAGSYFLKWTNGTASQTFLVSKQ